MCKTEKDRECVVRAYKQTLYVIAISLKDANCKSGLQ